MIGVELYRPLRTPLHMLPAWLKLAGLASVALSVFRIHDVTTVGIMAAAALTLFISTRPPARLGLRTVVLLMAFAALGGAFHWIFGDPSRGTHIALTLATVMFTAVAVTASTSMDAMLQVFGLLLWPLRRWIPHTTLALAASLVVRTVPEVARILQESAVAARARGLQRNPRAIAIPSGIRVVHHALTVGDAITARGLADVAPPTRDSL